MTLKETASAVPPGKRARNAAEIRSRLFVAAAKIVAQEGFANASIAKITAEAGIAQGTFYNYFESREAIFDALVPTFGKRMRDHIRMRVEGVEDFVEREGAAFAAFIEFFHANPFFARLLGEAEIFTPGPYKAYFDGILDGYRRAFRQAMRRGQIRHLTELEAEATALVFMSARNYLSFHYEAQIRKTGRLPKPVEAAYLHIVRSALAPI